MADDDDNNGCLHEFKTTTIYLGRGEGLIERACIHCGAPEIEHVQGLPPMKFSD